MRLPKEYSEILTYQDYLKLPEDGKRYEIIEGKLLMSPAPNTNHQTVSINLEFILYNFVRQHQLGRILHAPIDVILKEITIIQPDIIFISKERQSIIEYSGIFKAPDLVVEIVSPSSMMTDYNAKKDIYFKAGVQEYWIINIEHQSIDRHFLKDNSYIFERLTQNALLTSPLFPSLEVKLQEIFADILEK